MTKKQISLLECILKFRKRMAQQLLVVAGTVFLGPTGHAITLEELAEKVDALSKENAELRQLLNELQETQKNNSVVHEDLSARAVSPKQEQEKHEGLVIDHQVSYNLLDPTTAINRKQLYLLDTKRDKDGWSNTVHIGGALTAIADYQRSDTEGKFGYLMRHPTSSNQRTKTVSEAVIHSAQIDLTANLGDWTTAYLELLYDPEQSFGSGTITDVNRNQVQVRRGYVLFGDLSQSPYYVSLGKMAIPFGLTDTLNPFTASTVWHAFGGLAYGIQGGYHRAGLDLRLMGVQGGAQFRAANVPVDDSNVPSKLNNFALDASYRFPAVAGGDLLIGSSYIKGSAYCQSFPVTHFSSCDEENGAYAIYGQLGLDNWSFQGEFIRTEDQWPGTFNPSIPQFGASKVTSWDVGAKYSSRTGEFPIDFSMDFSRFEAGPGGAPWENQDQFVLGVATFIQPAVKLFGEIVRTEGYAPLNFVSGGNMAPGETHSDSDASSSIIMMGANVAF